MDEETYRFHQENLWETEGLMYYDKESGKALYTESFEEYYRPPKGICPVEEMIAGEVDRYRLILNLNDLGKSFLLLDGHLSKESLIERRTFSLS